MSVDSVAENSAQPPKDHDWRVYMILCSDGSLYTGITTDLDRRFRQHAAGCGAKYFRGRQPLRVVYLESSHSRSTAGIREMQIKRMPRADKCVLVSLYGNGGFSGGCPIDPYRATKEMPSRSFKRRLS